MSGAWWFENKATVNDDENVTKNHTSLDDETGGADLRKQFVLWAIANKQVGPIYIHLPSWCAEVVE